MNAASLPDLIYVYLFAFYALEILRALIYQGVNTAHPSVELRGAYRRMVCWTAAGVGLLVLVALLVPAFAPYGAERVHGVASAQGYACGLLLGGGFCVILAWERRHGVRVIRAGLQNRWIAAPRGGWRPVVEWSITLALVAAAATMAIVSLVG